MSQNVRWIEAPALKAALHDSNEIALLDAREEVPYSYRHLLMAACVPLSRLEYWLTPACRGDPPAWCGATTAKALPPAPPRA